MDINTQLVSKYFNEYHSQIEAFLATLPSLDRIYTTNEQPKHGDVVLKHFILHGNINGKDMVVKHTYVVRSISHDESV